MEAKYPAILFKQQLTACVEKIFGLIRDNLKKEISPLLGLCIQVGLSLLSLNTNTYINPQLCKLPLNLLCLSTVIMMFYSHYYPQVFIIIPYKIAYEFNQSVIQTVIFTPF